MNFFDAALTEEGGKMFISMGNYKLAVPPQRYDLYRQYVGKPVVMGVRPEDIHDPTYQPSNIIPSQIEANVDVVEQMGNEKIVYLEDSGKTFIARMDPRTNVSVGQRVPIVVDSSNIHLFDSQTEKALQ
jgi:multiple sugar transport system ATP-binding protein